MTDGQLQTAFLTMEHGTSATVQLTNRTIREGRPRSWKETFLNGYLHGENIGYYPDGAVQHRFVITGEGRKVGTNFEYYPGGKVKTKEVGSNNGTDLITLCLRRKRKPDGV